MPEGSGGGVWLAVVLAFLSFAGFEGAAALGEETSEPRARSARDPNRCPRSGLLYIICMLAQTWGFGTDAAGVAAFAGSGSPLGDLGTSYIGSSMGDAINLGAAVSAFASSLGTATGASRILYAMGRDGFGSSRLGTSSQRTASPAVALVVVMTIAIAAIIGMRLNGTNVVNAFFYPGTIGVLSLIVAYIVTNVGAIKLFGFDRQEKRWEMIISGLGIAFLLYVLWRNVSGQIYPYDHFWQVVAIWLLVGLGIVLLVPGLAKRIGSSLAQLSGGVSSG